MTRRRWMVAVVTAALIAAAGGWLVWTAAPPPPAAVTMVGPVTIAASRTVSPALIWIAADKGFFAKAGVAVTISPAATGKVAGEALMTGTADLAAATEFLTMRLSFAHDDLRTLGTLAAVHEIKVVGLAERGLRSAADLKGKRIGVTMGTNGEYFLARLLTLSGLAQDDIVWVDMPPQAMAAALADDQVDGVLVWPPFVQRIMAKFGDRAVAFDGQPGQDYYYLLLGRSDWLAANATAAGRIMQALAQADAWARANPQATETYLSEFLGLDRPALAEALAGYRLSIALPQSLLAALEAEARWLERRNKGSTRKFVDYREMTEPGPLLAAAPTMVTLDRTGGR